MTVGRFVEEFVHSEDGKGKRIHWLTGRQDPAEDTKEADWHYLKDGWATLTPPPARLHELSVARGTRSPGPTLSIALCATSLVAGEASGDLHASALIRALRAEDPEASFAFMGGDKMEAAAGVAPSSTTGEVGLHGHVSVVKNLGKLPASAGRYKLPYVTLPPMWSYLWTTQTSTSASSSPTPRGSYAAPSSTISSPSSGRGEQGAYASSAAM